MMKILVAPNAFKECLTAIQVTNSLTKGIKNAYPLAECIPFPLSDGGDGFLEIIKTCLTGEVFVHFVQGPRGDKLQSSLFYQSKEKTVFLEMAQSSGLARLSVDKRNPLFTSSLGTGEMLVQALLLNPERIIIGLGGSATCDGGIGLAHALGLRFLDKAGQTLEPYAYNLASIANIDFSRLSPRWKDVSVEAFCDVQNPLIGDQGAAKTYAPQKGASLEEVEQLEQGLTHFAKVIEQTLGYKIANLPYGGSSGGVGAGLFAFLGAKLFSGAQALLQCLEAEKQIKNADLVLTAEGRLDSQTIYGKIPFEVAKLAQKQKRPCFVFAGQIAPESEKLHSFGMSALFSICPYPLSLAEAFSQAETFLSRSAEEAFRAFLCGQKKLF